MENTDEDGHDLCVCQFTLAYGTKILLHNTKLCLKKGDSPGTKKYERENFRGLLEIGYVDAHRFLYPLDKLWTWWDVRSKSRNKDNGWRLDYFLVSHESIIKDGEILKSIYGSDHCPIMLDIIGQ